MCWCLIVLLVVCLVLRFSVVCGCEYCGSGVGDCYFGVGVGVVFGGCYCGINVGVLY